ncbi:MAG TPA: DNA-binding domain-containing protein [Myxococcota bacterium]|nr:DNA-binding domain-containing protein [Myxococcota bacterium]
MSARLASAQRDFAAWVMAREAPAFTPGLSGDARADARERLGIYRHAFLARLVEVLADDYPALKRALGDAGFDALSAAYVHALPSRSPSLRDLGARLPSFIAEHAAGREWAASAPWAADLARLELAVTDAFDAEDARPLVRTDLAAIAPAQWGDLSLSLMPGAQLLALAWPVRVLRSAHDAEQPLALEVLTRRSERVLVWRRDERVLHREVEAGEAELLARLAAGARFGELCALAAEARGDAAGAAFAAELLGRWVEDELLRALESAR